jgi:hypothetical protein
MAVDAVYCELLSAKFAGNSGRKPSSAGYSARKQRVTSEV